MTYNRFHANTGVTEKYKIHNLNNLMIVSTKIEMDTTTEF